MTRFVTTTSIYVVVVLVVVLLTLPTGQGFSPARWTTPTPSGSSVQAQTQTQVPKVPVVALSMAASGPKAEGRRRTPRGDRSSSGSSDAPKPHQQRRAPRQRRQESTTSAPAPAPAPAVRFDGKAMTAAQTSNEDATALDLKSVLSSQTMRCMTPNIGFENKSNVQLPLPPFKFMSLDDLFGPELGLSAKFNDANGKFREDLRTAIRKDIFDTTPFYANLSEKAASVLLLPDSSLEGSWRMPESMDRMKCTTQVLRDALGGDDTNSNSKNIPIPTGDELFQAIGKLCGPKPSTHWIDIYGVQDRKINHSWHLDCGSSPENVHTVLWGFPPVADKDNGDEYQGCGVFSHVIPLQQECIAPQDHPRMQPVLFDGTVEEQYIVRPKYEPGKELLMYRDVDVLHSAPDVTYRTSVMRFM